MKNKYYIYVSELLKGVKACEYSEELANTCKESKEEINQYLEEIKKEFSSILNNNNYIYIQIYNNDIFLKDLKIYK